MQGRELIGVILAAGKATRMWPFSARYPKPVLPVCNRPLIEYQVREMQHLGIREIIVVVGHLGFEITKALNDGSQYGVRLRYIDQRETRGIAHAVGQLEEYIDRPFLLFLGDIFFQVRNLAQMFELMDQGAHAVLAVRNGENPEAIRRNFAVVLDEGGLVKRVMEKPRHAPNKLKGCGLYLFDPHIFDAIRRTPRTAGRDEYEITDAIQILINDGFSVRVAEVVKYDINLTYPCDLLACNLRQLRALGVEKLVGQDVRLPQDVKVINSVIGDRVRADYALEIRDSLILADTEVRAQGPIENTILAGDDVIDCRFEKGPDAISRL